MIDIEQNFKSIQRRVHNIKYCKTALASGYEEREEKYRNIRNGIRGYKSSIRDMICYEHGGKEIKTIKDGLSNIDRKLNKEYFKAESIYEKAWRSLSKIKDSEKCKRVSKNYSEALKGIQECKSVFNEKMQKCLAVINEVERISQSIDNKRVQVKNKRYDLEKTLKKEGVSEEEIERMKKDFAVAQNLTLQSMNDFIESNQIYEAVNEASKAHYEFLCSSFEKIKIVK